MTAIDNWITELNAGKYSDLSQEVISKVSTVIAALNFIAGGLAPSGPELANTFLAGPTVAPAALPTYRAIVAADIGSTLNLAVRSIALNGAAISIADISTTGPIFALTSYIAF